MFLLALTLQSSVNQVRSTPADFVCAPGDPLNAGFYLYIIDKTLNYQAQIVDYSYDAFGGSTYVTVAFQNVIVQFNGRP